MAGAFLFQALFNANWRWNRVARRFVFKQKIPNVHIFEGLRMKNVDIFYCRLDYSMDIWDIL
jgi:hypothetical protein